MIDRIVMSWHEWVIFIAIFVSMAVVITVFFDVQNTLESNSAMGVRLGAVIGVLLTALPAFYTHVVLFTDVSDREIFFNSDSDVIFFALGVTGVLVSIGAFVAYMLMESAVSPSVYTPRTPINQNQVVDNHNFSFPNHIERIPERHDDTPIASPSWDPPTPEIAPTRPLEQTPDATAWVVVNNQDSSQKHDLKGNNLIGRDKRKANIILSDDTVSREHARIQADNGQFFLSDLGSTSGTYINDRLVRKQKHLLYDDDRIMVGRIELIFKKI